MDDMADWAAETLKPTVVMLSTPALLAEVDAGLALRVCRHQTTARDVHLIQSMADRLRSVAVPVAAHREPLEGMLMLDMPEERAPSLRFNGIERRREPQCPALVGIGGRRMSRATFNRMLLLVHGQGNELETPPATQQSREGSLAYRSSMCSGRVEHEMDCDIPPDASRTFRPAPLPEDVRSRMNRLALYLSALLFGVLAGLLEAFGAAPFNHDF